MKNRKKAFLSGRLFLIIAAIVLCIVLLFGICVGTFFIFRHFDRAQEHSSVITNNQKDEVVPDKGENKDIIPKKETLRDIAEGKLCLSDSIVGQLMKLNGLSNTDKSFGGDLTVKPEKSFYDFISLFGVDPGNLPSYLSWVKNISTDYRIQSSDGIMMINAPLAVNGTHICTVNTVLDDNGRECYTTIPELTKTAAKNNIDTKYPINISDHAELLAQLIPDEQTTRQFVNRYLEILYSEFEDTTVQKGEFTNDDGITTECNYIEISADKQKTSDFLLKLLETAKKDSDLKNCFEVLSVFARNNGGTIAGTSFPDITYEELTDIVCKSIDTGTETEAIGITIRFDDEYSIFSIEIRYGDKNVLSAYSLCDKENTVSEKLIYNGAVIINGTGSITDEKKSIIYKISDSWSNELFTISFKDLEKEDKDGNTVYVGTVILTPGKDFKKAVPDNFTFLKDCRLNSGFTYNKVDGLSLSGTLYIVKDKVCSFDFDICEIEETATIALPTDYIDVRSENFTSEYLKNASLGSIKTNIKNAGASATVNFILGVLEKTLQSGIKK